MGDHAGRLDAASFFVSSVFVCILLSFPFLSFMFSSCRSRFIPRSMFLILLVVLCDLFVALFRCLSFICSVALYVLLHVLDATHYLWVPWRRGEMESEAAQGNVCTVYVISALN